MRPNPAKRNSPKAASQQQAPREKEPVRVDYLTALADIVNPEIYIYKEKRRLYVVQSDVMVRDYPIGLGLHPVGDKESERDGRTPEGDFVVRRKDPVSRFNKALLLNYPDKKHAERALFRRHYFTARVQGDIDSRRAQRNASLVHETR